MATDARVEAILRDLHRLSGCRLSLHDPQFREIAAFPPEPLPFCRTLQKNGEAKKICQECDRSAFALAEEDGQRHVYRCHFGLTEIISPLYRSGMLLGYLMMGQIAPRENGAREETLATAAPFGSGPVLRRALSECAAPGEEQVQTLARMMTVCADYLALCGAVRPQGDLGMQIEEYLLANYHRRITLQGLSGHFRCGRSTLIKAYARTHPESIAKTLLRIRLQAAQDLLADPTLSVGEVARRCGFSDGGYFSKVWRREKGTLPTSRRE